MDELCSALIKAKPHDVAQFMADWVKTLQRHGHGQSNTHSRAAGGRS
jgi:hypothetical protein